MAKQIIAPISSKGQVTLPAEIRKQLGLNKRGKVAFVIEPAGVIRIEAPRYGDIASLAGAAGSLEKPLGWKEMLAIAYEDRFAAKTSEQS